jgi:hypothetical protein
MQRRHTGRSLLIMGVVAFAAAAISSPAFATHSTPNRYVLRHPKREHCKAHYAKKVITVTERLHGHKKKTRRTVCLHHHGTRAALSWGKLTATPLNVPPFAAPQQTVDFSPPPLAPSPASPPARERERQPRESPAPLCTSTFIGSDDNSWGVAANWSGGIPAGISSYGCIPSTYPAAVAFTSEASTEIGGVSAENAAGIAFASGRLTLANPADTSVINNVKHGETPDSVIALDEGVTLELTGGNGELGGNTWSGPGTVKVPHGAWLRTGKCLSWGGERETRCIGGTPTPGAQGLRVENRGTIVGAGISLCRNSAAHPAELENEGSIRISLSGGFGGAPDCGEVGSVVNGENGAIQFANLDGHGCNVRDTVTSLINKGKVNLGSCFTPETAELQRPTLEIGSSVSAAGTIVNGGIVQIAGNYAPTSSANLVIGVKQTYPVGSPETNYGTVRVTGNAVLGGELNVETPGNVSPALGQTYDILNAGEVEGSLSGEFVLRSHCIAAEPGLGYNVIYKPGSKGSVMLEVANVPGC